jgi:hypothetical protein
VEGAAGLRLRSRRRCSARSTTAWTPRRGWSRSSAIATGRSTPRSGRSRPGRRPTRRSPTSTRYLQQTHVQFRVVGYRPEDVDLVGEELWATFDLAREVNGVDIWRDPLRFAKGVETDAVRGVCPLIRDDSRGPNQRVLYYYVIPYDFDTDRTN